MRHRWLAAEKLSLSQLETEVGVRLLDRGRGGLRLTHAGEVLLEHANHVVWRLQLADVEITDLAEDRRDHVRLGAFPTALAGFVPSAIARLRLAHRDLRILLSEVTASALEPRFLSGEFDVAIGYQDATTERRDFQNAQRIDLFQETFLVGLPPQHRLAGATGTVSLAKFAKDDWIVPSTEGFLITPAATPASILASCRPQATRSLRVASSLAESASDGYRVF